MRGREIRLLNEMKRGVYLRHPIFNMLLGLCTTLAVSISLVNAFAMSMATIFVLSFSNLSISLLRNNIRKEIHLPAFLVIISGFVTVVEISLKGFYPELHKALGIYLPLIAVNCIVLARAESYAYRAKPLFSFFDGLGMGLGYAWGILLISFIRELLGTGKIEFWIINLSLNISPIKILTLPPGGFLTMGLILAFLKFREVRK